MVKFTLFGIPVTIHPWFWLTLAFVSGGLGANSSEAFLNIGLFVIAGTVSVLVHELGHALVGRKLGGSYPTIELVAFGGLAYNHGGRFTKWQSFWMIAAGPGAGFLLMFTVMAGLGLAFGDTDALSITRLALLGKFGHLQLSTLEFISSRPQIFSLIVDFLQINFWWGILNLLPILPLDGGRITDLFVRPQKRVYLIGIIASGAGALWALSRGQTYMAMFFGYYGYTNYKAMKENPWS